jgi:hypothetical protein
MAQTLHDRLVTALQQKGLILLPPTGRFTRLQPNRLDQYGRRFFYYVGRSGSLRVGYSVTKSTPVIDRVKSSLLAPPKPVSLSELDTLQS